MEEALSIRLEVMRVGSVWNWGSQDLTTVVLSYIV